MKPESVLAISIVLIITFVVALIWIHNMEGLFLFLSGFFLSISFISSAYQSENNY